MKKKSNKRTHHFIRVQYQRGKETLYTEVYNDYTNGGVTLQDMYMTCIGFLAGVESYIEDKKLYGAICQSILKKMISHAKYSTMDYITLKQSETILDVKQKFKSNKFNNERVDFELVTTLLKFKDDDSLISKVINIFKNAKKD